MWRCYRSISLYIKIYIYISKCVGDEFGAMEDDDNEPVKPKKKR